MSYKQMPRSYQVKMMGQPQIFAEFTSIADAKEYAQILADRWNSGHSVERVGKYLGDHQQYYEEFMPKVKA